MSTKFVLMFILVISNTVIVFSQNQNSKTGGISFRIDDNQPIERWKQFNDIFERYGFHFSYAINPAIIGSNQSYINCIKELQNKHNDLLDHTPNHNTAYFTDMNAVKYEGIKGIDHINNNKVCLSYENIETGTYKNEGNVSIDNNIVTSINNGEFKGINTDLIPFIFINKLNKIFKIYKLQNFNVNDPDTLEIQTFWDEPVSGYSEQNVQYEKIGIYDVVISDEGLENMAKSSLKLFSGIGLSRPLFWAQPGGNTPQLNKKQVKRVLGEKCGYIGAATYPNPAYKVYEESNPDSDKQYAIQWGQLTPELSYFNSMKKEIAQAVAKHKVLIASGHFKTTQSNGWSDYLQRIDSLLSWCKQNTIPVMTNLELTQKLYYQQMNPFENIIPQLNKDIDENNIPDGYEYGPEYANVFWDKVDGVKEGNYHSLAINKDGNICRILDLAGLAKGENDFYIWVKGYPGSKIEVTFTMQNVNQSISYLFNTDSTSWKKYTLQNSQNLNTSLFIPKNATFADIKITARNLNGHEVKISGMSLKKKPSGSIIPPFGLAAKLNKNISLSWLDNSDNEAGFIIQRKDDSLDVYKIIDTTSTDINNYIDSTIDRLGKNKKYKYRVQAYTKESESEFSNECNVETGGDDATPVELSSFVFEIDPERKIILKWRTITEINNKGFEIQRNLGNNWEKIEFVEGAGTSSALHYYSIIDDFKNNSFQGIAKYRIKQINFDSSFGYSDVLSVNVNFLPKSFLVDNNFPNPFNSSTIIRYELPEDSNVSLDIYNSLGEKVITLLDNVKQPVGIYVKEWMAGNISSGIYFARITASSIRNAGPRNSKVRKMLLLK